MSTPPTVALFYACTPGTPSGYSFHTATQPFSRTLRLSVTSARLHPVPISATFHDFWFRHRKLHRLYCLAGWTAVALPTVDERFGHDTFASSREKLPYAVFESPSVAYAPRGLTIPREIICSGFSSVLVLDVSAPGRDVAGYLAELTRFANGELHHELARTGVDGPGQLYAGKYILDAALGADRGGSTARLKITTRRSQDHERVTQVVKRFFAAKLRREKIRAWVPRGQEWSLRGHFGGKGWTGYSAWARIPPGYVRCVGHAWQVFLEFIVMLGEFCAWLLDLGVDVDFARGWLIWALMWILRVIGTCVCVDCGSFASTTSSFARNGTRVSGACFAGRCRGLTRCVGEIYSCSQKHQACMLVSTSVIAMRSTISCTVITSSRASPGPIESRSTCLRNFTCHKT